MEIEIRVEVLFVEGRDRLGMRGRDVPVAPVLSPHRSVLRLRQAIVVGVPGPRLGLLHQQFVEQLDHGVVDELAAVVGVEAPDAKGEL